MIVTSDDNVHNVVREFWRHKYRFMGYAENSALASQMIVFETYKGYSIYWGISIDNLSVNKSSLSSQTNSSIHMLNQASVM